MFFLLGVPLNARWRTLGFSGIKTNAGTYHKMAPLAPALPALNTSSAVRPALVCGRGRLTRAGGRLVFIPSTKSVSYVVRLALLPVIFPRSYFFPGLLPLPCSTALSPLPTDPALCYASPRASPRRLPLPPGRLPPPPPPPPPRPARCSHSRVDIEPSWAADSRRRGKVRRPNHHSELDRRHRR